jgi:hypothetical protein
MNTLFNMLCGSTYGAAKAIEDYYKFKIKETEEKRKEEVRRVRASLDNGESFKANFEPDDVYNWDIFKNKD